MVEAFCRAIDKINDWVGRWASLTFIPLTLIVTIEVIARRFFGKPIIWAWDVNIQLAAALVVLGGGFLLIENGHVIVDVIANKFPKRVRAIVDMVTSSIFFLGVGMLLYLSIGEAQKSVVTHERYTSLLEPPLAPIRIVVAIGFFLLLIQGIAKFIRDLRIATGSEMEAKS